MFLFSYSSFNVVIKTDTCLDDLFEAAKKTPMCKQRKCLPGGTVVKNLPAYIGDMFRSQEKEMATHSSILAWKVPWTEEAGRLQSMESQRVGQDLVTEHARTQRAKKHQPSFFP